VTAASTTPVDDLPFTGADSVSLAALGLTAMVVGGIAVAATRRRTPEES
jgi:LPXTG-motif cell wall-anchored protein